MALILPIPFDTKLVTEQDLGRGFNIDENGEKAKKNQIYLPERGNIITEYKTVDQNKLTLLRDQESLVSALEIGGQISLSFGILKGKIEGSYIDNTFSSSEKLTYLYTRRIVSKVVEFDYNTKVTPDINKIKNIEELRSKYGSYYIKKIEYGAMMDVKITLQSEDEARINKLKGELTITVGFGPFSFDIKSSIEKTMSDSSSSKLNVTSNVYMVGCKQPLSKEIKSFDEAEKLISGFTLDPDNLIPIRIELSPLPPILTPLLNIDAVNIRYYNSKLSQVGAKFWEFEVLIVHLRTLESLVSRVIEEEKIYITTLLERVRKLTTKLVESQSKNSKFMENSFIYIIDNPIPYSDVELTQFKMEVLRLTGTTTTTTPLGSWFGPAVDNVPTYKGTYRYSNGTIFKGLCLNGKRHGKGIMTYPSGNVDQLISIEGQWRNDEVSYPTTIKYGDRVVEIKNEEQYKSWKTDQKTKPIANFVEFFDLSTSDEYHYKYRCDLDKINNTDFKQFFDQLRRSVNPNRDRYYYLFMGMAESGKTALIEYFLNAFTGQIQSPQVLRATQLEDVNGGHSKTQQVCRYEIEYIHYESWVFSITFIDSPGFTGIFDLKRENKNVKSILNTIGKIDKIDSILYTVKGNSTKESLQPIQSLRNIFSPIPNVSPIITFTEDSTQVNNIKKMLNDLMNGINDRPSLSIDNPWSQYLRMYHKELVSDTNNESQSQNDVQKRLEKKLKIINSFLIGLIRSYQLYGMISCKIMDINIDNSFTGSEKLSFFYKRRILSKVTQLNQNAQESFTPMI